MAASAAPFHIRAAAGAAERPNLLWIVLDTARARSFSCYGYERLTSPNVDRVAEAGALFENTYSQAFWTAPSLACYMTSRYFPDWVVEPTKFAKTTLVRPREDEVLAPLAFRAAGYNTAMFSAHHGYVLPSSRLGQAFNLCRMVPAASWESPGSAEKAQRAQTFREVNQLLLPWLKKHGHGPKPFFAYVHAMDQHSPYVIPLKPPFNQWLQEDYRGRYIRNFTCTLPMLAGKKAAPEDRAQLYGLYDGTIRHADHYLGQVLDLLDSEGLAGRTMVVITSDHGESLLENPQIYSHSARPGLPGADETHHIPLLLRGPGIPRGKRIPAPTQSIDILPTLAELCDVPLKGAIDGRSLRAYLDDGAPPEPLPMVFTKADTHDVLSREPDYPKTGRVFLRSHQYKVRLSRDIPEETAAWHVPDRQGARQQVTGSEEKTALAAAKDYFKRDIAPLEAEAIANIPPHVLVFPLGHRLTPAPANKAKILRTQPKEHYGEELGAQWLVEEPPGQFPVLSCTADTARIPLKLWIETVIRGQYRFLIEMYAEQNAESTIQFAANKCPRRTLKAPADKGAAGWTWVAYELPVPTVTYAVFFGLIPTGAPCRFRRAVMYADTPVAAAYVRKHILGDSSGRETEEDRTKALDALGYL